jgi:1,4-dihydroxy-2-naphthoyl-CoA hydrolase
MPVDERTKQPFGLLHGGANVALAETLGSVASLLVVNSDVFIGVGVEINANHIKAVLSGKGKRCLLSIKCCWEKSCVGY